MEGSPQGGPFEFSGGGQFRFQKPRKIMSSAFMVRPCWSAYDPTRFFSSFDETAAMYWVSMTLPVPAISKAGLRSRAGGGASSSGCSGTTIRGESRSK